MGDKTTGPDRERLRELMARADPAGQLQAGPAMEAAREALALAERLGDEHAVARAGAWLACHSLHLGDFAGTLDHGTGVLDQLAATGEAELRMEVLRVIAIAGSELGRFEQALKAAEELMQLASRRADADAPLKAALAMAVCFERMGDSWQAMRLLSQALAEHGGKGSGPVLMSVGNAVCTICATIALLLRDCDSEDERQEVLERGREAGELALRLAEGQSNAVPLLCTQINLAEVLIAQGELARAAALLPPARDAAKRHGLRLHAYVGESNLAEVLLRQGQGLAALNAIDALLSEMGTEVPSAMASKANEIAYRACKALGDFERALQHFERHERLQRAALTQQLRSQSNLLVTRSEERSARVQAAEAQQEAQRQRKEAERFAADAERDPLTQLGNRRHLEHRMAELLPRLEREGRHVALAQIDVDHFKKVNDDHGHAAGDAVLVALAQRLTRNSRAADVLIRHGGEEFVVVLPDTPTEIAIEVCERLRAQAESMLVALPDGRSLKITVSIGLSVSPPHELATLLRQADEALYAAKRAGRNRLCLWSADAPRAVATG